MRRKERREEKRYRGSNKEREGPVVSGRNERTRVQRTWEGGIDSD